MDENEKPKAMGDVIQIDEARIRDHLGEMVRGTVEEALNAMLEGLRISIRASRHKQAGHMITTGQNRTKLAVANTGHPHRNYTSVSLGIPNETNFRLVALALAEAEVRLVSTKGALDAFEGGDTQSNAARG